MGTEPFVSGVITVRDGEAHLAEAIESMLAQTHPLAEVIVVDNGSTDASRAVAERYMPEVRVVTEPEPGVGPARNAGLAAVGRESEYVGYLDHDDIWEPRKTELQLAAFAADPAPDLVFGMVEQFFSPEADPRIAASIRVPEGPRPALFLGSLLATRSAWGRVGPWAKDTGLADLLEWLLRARRLGLREASVPELVVRRRIHGANRSIRHRDLRMKWTTELKRSLDERRGREVE